MHLAFSSSEISILLWLSSSIGVEPSAAGAGGMVTGAGTGADRGAGTQAAGLVGRKVPSSLRGGVVSAGSAASAGLGLLLPLELPLPGSGIQPCGHTLEFPERGPFLRCQLVFDWIVQTVIEVGGEGRVVVLRVLAVDCEPGDVFRHRAIVLSEEPDGCLGVSLEVRVAVEGSDGSDECLERLELWRGVTVSPHRKGVDDRLEP